MTVDFIGRGWASPLGVKPNGSIATATGEAKLEQSMRIILSTHLGERPMRPLFGSLLRDFLFGGVSEQAALDVASEVRRAIESCEPRVIVDSVEAVPMDEPYGGFDIDIHYTVKSTNEARNLVVPFYSIPGEEG
jgi:phage baseplate assembly protein W